MTLLIYLVYNGDIEAKLVPGCQPDWIAQSAFLFPGDFVPCGTLELHSESKVLRKEGIGLVKNWEN